MKFFVKFVDIIIDLQYDDDQAQNLKNAICTNFQRRITYYHAVFLDLLLKDILILL